ncbi:MAG: Tim44 domain-containing protein, partial [Magnetococcus sp. WYHC-3]
ARRAFGMVQQAWESQDMSGLKGLVNERLLQTLAGQMEAMKAAGQRNTVTVVSLDRADITEAWQEAGQDYITVQFQAMLIEALHDRDGRLLDGDPGNAAPVEEYWTFTRPAGSTNPNWWLTAIQQPGDVAVSG